MLIQVMYGVFGGKNYVNKLQKHYTSHQKEWLKGKADNYNFSTEKVIDMSATTTTDPKVDKKAYQFNTELTTAILQNMNNMSLIDPARGWGGVESDDTTASVRKVLDVLSNTADSGKYLQTTGVGSDSGLQIYAFKVNWNALEQDKSILGISDKDIKRLKSYVSQKGGLYLGYETYGSGGGYDPGPGNAVSTLIGKYNVKLSSEAALIAMALKDPETAYDYNAENRFINSLSEFTTEGATYQDGYTFGIYGRGLSYKARKISDGVRTDLLVTFQDQYGNSWNIQIPANTKSVENVGKQISYVIAKLRYYDHSFTDNIDINTIRSIFLDARNRNISVDQAIDDYIKERQELLKQTQKNS